MDRRLHEIKQNDFTHIVCTHGGSPRPPAHRVARGGRADVRGRPPPPYLCVRRRLLGTSSAGGSADRLPNANATTVLKEGNRGGGDVDHCVSAE